MQWQRSNGPTHWRSALDKELRGDGVNETRARPLWVGGTRTWIGDNYDNLYTPTLI